MMPDTLSDFPTKRPMNSAPRWLASWAAGFVVASVTAFAHAQGPTTFPVKPVRIVIPSAAGGAADFLARTVGHELSKAWGQPVVIESRPGGAGVIATQYVVRSPGNGYTLLGGSTYLIQMPPMKDDIPYDVWKDLLPVSQIMVTDDLLVIPASLPVSSLEEFVRFAKANPSQVSIGSYGNGTSSHLHAELFRRQGHLDGAVHVPYPGGAPLLNALVGSQIASGMMDIAGTRAHYKSGKLRILAKTGPTRSSLLPDVPTFTELGYKDFEPNGFFGLFAPAGTPQDVVAKISEEVQKIVSRPEIRHKFAEAGLLGVANSPKAFEDMMRRDAKVWQAIARDSNIRIE